MSNWETTLVYKVQAGLEFHSFHWSMILHETVPGYKMGINISFRCSIGFAPARAYLQVLGKYKTVFTRSGHWE